MDTSAFKNQLTDALAFEGTNGERLEKNQVGWVNESLDELTLVVANEHFLSVCQMLKTRFDFEMLVDLCAVDYSTYGEGDFDERSQNTGFSRAKMKKGADLALKDNPFLKTRFWVVIHLLSIKHNQRLRLKVPALPMKGMEGSDLVAVESVSSIWPVADWYEREAFDLLGVIFLNHPDLRRILLDYNFQGHPLRKDFPLEGDVEVSYDDDQQRVKYRKVSIENRMNHARVVRLEGSKPAKLSDESGVQPETANL